MIVIMLMVGYFKIWVNLNGYLSIFIKYSMLSYLILINLFVFSYISLFVYDLIIIWFLLEIINLMFIYLLNMFMDSKKMVFFYFIIQIMSSFLLVFPIVINSIFMFNSYLYVMLMLTLGIKLGIPPFHFWLPLISNFMPWDMLIFLITVQKVVPFYMMSLIKIDDFFVFYVVLILSSIIPPFMSLDLTNFKVIIAYSSINQSGWMLMLIYMKTIIWFKYIVLYSLSLFLSVYMFYIFKMFKGFTVVWNFSLNLLFLFVMFNLAGLPPFTMFYLKWYSIFLFMKANNLVFILILMMFSSLFMLYIYVSMLVVSLYFYMLECKLVKFSGFSKVGFLFFYFYFPLLLISSVFVMM